MASHIADWAKLAESPRVRSDGGMLPPMVSFSQNFEDVLLRRALQDIENGCYIDIGAADPHNDSVTCWFYKNGWRGVNVEPDARYFSQLAAARPEDINLQCAVSATGGSLILSIAAVGGLSTGNAERLNELVTHEQIQTSSVIVQAVTVDQLMAQALKKDIDFLKIDVEGMETEILGSTSFVAFRPRIIIVEATKPNTQIPSHGDWEPSLLSKGYLFAYFDGLNRFYVREEDKWRLAYFAIPPCFFDNFFQPTIKAKLDEAIVAVEAAAQAHAATCIEAAQAHAATCIEAAQIEIRNAAVAFENQRSAATAETQRAEQRTSEALAAFEDLKLSVAVQLEAAEIWRSAAAEATARAEASEQTVRDQAARIILLQAGCERAAALEQDARDQAVRSVLQRAAWKEALERVEHSSAATMCELEAKLATAADQIGVLETTLLRVSRDSEAALRREQTAEAAAAEALRLQRVAEARYAETMQRLENRETPGLERLRVLEVELLRSHREVAHALAREQAAEAAAAETGRRLAALEAELAQGLVVLRASEAAQRNRKRGSASRFDLFAQIRLLRLRQSARGAARTARWSEAEAAYEAMIAVRGDIAPVWVQYGHSLKEQGKFRDAALAYSEALAIDPENADTHLQIGHAFKLQGSRSMAMQAYATAFRLMPRREDARRELESLGFSRLQLVEAMLRQKTGASTAHPTAASAGSLGIGGRIKLERARMAARRRDWSVAVQRYRVLATQCPDVAAIWVQLGNALKEMRLLRDAELAYFEAIRCDARRADTFVQLAGALDLQGFTEAAFCARRQAFRLEPALFDGDEPLQQRLMAGL